MTPAAGRPPDRLAAGLAEAVREGLGVRWTRVSVWRVARGAGAWRRPRRPVRSPSASPDLSMPMEHAGEPVGIIECGSTEAGTPLAVDRDLLAMLAAHAAVAIRNATLADELAALEELRAQARELAASRARLVRAQDAERRRIERDIHDGAQQELVALLTNLGLARQQLRRGALLDEVLAQLRRTPATQSPTFASSSSGFGRLSAIRA